MQQNTFRLPEETLEKVETEAEERGVSRSEHIRAILEESASHDEYERLQSEYDALQTERDELQREHERLREHVEDLEAEVERTEAHADDLRRQLSEANARNDDVDELVRAVEVDRSLAERKARTGTLTRLKWWAVGMPAHGDER